MVLLDSGLALKLMAGDFIKGLFMAKVFLAVCTGDILALSIKKLQSCIAFGAHVVILVCN